MILDENFFLNGPSPAEYDDVPESPEPSDNSDFYGDDTMEDDISYTSSDDYGTEEECEDCDDDDYDASDEPNVWYDDSSEEYTDEYADESDFGF